MQYISRPADAPAVLRSHEATQSRRAMQEYMALGRERRAQTSVPQIGIDPHSMLLVKELSFLSQGKCAFCEARDRLSAHRFRPVGNALPLSARKDAHLFYVWLADAWHNLLPICTGCRPKEPIFPVEGARCRLPGPGQISAYVSRADGIWSPTAPDERNLLIDPTRETSYDKHFKPKLDGTLVAVSPRAATTIETFDLNRPDRQMQRSDRHQEYLDRLRTFMAGGPGSRQFAKQKDAWNDLFDYDALEFGGTWYLLLKRIAAQTEWPDSAPASTKRAHLKAFFAQLADDGDGLTRLDQSLAAVSREDPSLRSVEPGARRVHRVRAQLRSVELTNFKSIERLRIEFPEAHPNQEPAALAPSLVVLGENATGKSGLLEAVALTVTTEEARRLIDPGLG